jgi:hypothetical protein
MSQNPVTSSEEKMREQVAQWKAMPEETLIQFLTEKPQSVRRAFAEHELLKRRNRKPIWIAGLAAAGSVASGIVAIIALIRTFP